jgi:hypothetical protein
MEFFPGIVSNAQTVDVLVKGMSGRDESLIMVTHRCRGHLSPPFYFVVTTVETMAN